MITIREEQMSEIFTKFYLGGLPFHAVLHHFTEAEPINASAHNHPFDFRTHILKGWYVERVWTCLKPSSVWDYEDVLIEEGSVHHVRAEHIHQIIDMSVGGCYTLILPEPKKQDWGFWEIQGDKMTFRPFDE